MMKRILLQLILIFIAVTGFAQGNSYFGIKLGGDIVGGYTIDEHFRKSPNNIKDNGSYRTPARYDVFKLRFTYTKFTNNKRFGFTGGLRYSYVNAFITKNEVFMFHGDANTYYYSVKGLSQKVHYIGIPLDVEFIVTNPEAMVRMFFNVGCNFDFKVKSSFDMGLKDANVVYNGTIDNAKDAICEPKGFCFSTFVGIGMHIGRPHQVNGTIEFNMPYYGYNNIGIFDGRLGGGLSAGINIPLN